MPDDDKPAPKAKPKADGPAYRVVKALQWGTHRAAPGTIRRDIPVQSVDWLIADGSIRLLTDDEAQAHATSRDTPTEEEAAPTESFTWLDEAHIGAVEGGADHVGD